jgi:hypothetical protein
VRVVFCGILENVSLGNVKGVPSDDGSCDQNVSLRNVQSTLQEDDLMKAKNDENNDETKVTKEKDDETKVTKAKMMSKKHEPYWWRKTENKNWSLDEKIKFCQKKLFHQLTRVADIPTVKGKKQNWKELRKTWRKCEMFLQSRYQKILDKQNARVSSRKSCPRLPQCPCCQNSSVLCRTKTTEKKSSNLKSKTKNMKKQRSTLTEQNELDELTEYCEEKSETECDDDSECDSVEGESSDELFHPLVCRSPHLVHYACPNELCCALPQPLCAVFEAD